MAARRQNNMEMVGHDQGRAGDRFCEDRPCVQRTRLAVSPSATAYGEGVKRSGMLGVMKRYTERERERLVAESESWNGSVAAPARPWSYERPSDPASSRSRPRVAARQRYNMEMVGHDRARAGDRFCEDRPCVQRTRLARHSVPISQKITQNYTLLF